MHHLDPSLDRIQKLAVAAFVAAAFLLPASTHARADNSGLMAPAPEPVSAPAIDLPKPDGSLFSLTARPGKFTLVNFWALWCAPCKKEMPDLALLKDRMSRHGLDVVAVNLGDKTARIAQFTKQVDLRNLTILLDRDGETGKAWHVQGLPVTFLVGPDGRISHAALGARDWASENAVRWLENVIAATSEP